MIMIHDLTCVLVVKIDDCCIALATLGISHTSKLGMHAHMPVLKSHTPALEHGSITSCATFATIGSWNLREHM